MNPGFDLTIQNWVHEAVFGFKEAGMKLDVTTQSTGSRKESNPSFGMTQSNILKGAVFLHMPHTFPSNQSGKTDTILPYEYTDILQTCGETVPISQSLSLP